MPCAKIVHTGLAYASLPYIWHDVILLFIGIFDDTFIDYLFELVEQTRHMQDETFNYGVIKLIVSRSTVVCNAEASC